MEKLVVFLTLFFNTGICSLLSQNYLHIEPDSLVKDTIWIEQNMLIISIPFQGTINKYTDRYEEGYFIIYPLKDSSFFVVFRGHNVEHPLFNNENITNIKYCKNHNEYYGKQEHFFFREDYYYNFKCALLYCYVRELDKPLLDSILNNVIFSQKHTF